MDNKIQENMSNSIDISKLINEDNEQNSDSLGVASYAIHTQSYRSHAISTSFG